MSQPTATVTMTTLASTTPPVTATTTVTTVTTAPSPGDDVGNDVVDGADAVNAHNICIGYLLSREVRCETFIDCCNSHDFILSDAQLQPHRPLMSYLFVDPRHSAVINGFVLLGLPSFAAPVPMRFHCLFRHVLTAIGTSASTFPAVGGSKFLSTRESQDLPTFPRFVPRRLQVAVCSHPLS
jgi:hypothetical protein